MLKAIKGLINSIRPSVKADICVVKVTRFQQTKSSTISTVTVDDEFICYVLEDGYNEKKVWGQTRIPAGTYPITFRTEGTFAMKYGHPMLWIRNIPGFEYVLIHKGNTVNDTAGCLITGDEYAIKQGNYFIRAGFSTPAYDRLYSKLSDKLRKGFQVEIQIIENFV